jgi:hypothetical protein
MAYLSIPRNLGGENDVQSRISGRCAERKTVIEFLGAVYPFEASLA